MYTPSGEDAGNMDRVMLLALWTMAIEQNSNNIEAKEGKSSRNDESGERKESGSNRSESSVPKKMIAGGMGKPTFAINDKVALEAMDRWQQLYVSSLQARRDLEPLYKEACLDKAIELGGINQEEIIQNKSENEETKKLQEVVKEVSNNARSAREAIITKKAASGYGNPQGDTEARELMAQAFTKWYDQPIDKDHVLFTVGDAGALHATFKVINKRVPNGRIVTPFPHYSLYAGADGQNNLHPIDVMREKGYCLTAKALEQSIANATANAELDGKKISAFLFCDPSNPLGTVVGADEWRRIAAVLRKNPGIPIILDEAYAELQLNGKKLVSLLHVAPDLRSRMIIMRSATKGLSAAGERMAVAMVFDKQLMAEILSANIGVYGHSSRINQHAYAKAMSQLDDKELETIAVFYRKQVELVNKRIKKMGAAMPDPDHKVEGSFYVMADLSELLGAPLSSEAKAAVGNKEFAETDEDVIYNLLFKRKIMICPLSYFGVDKKLGYVRITCSGGDAELTEMMDRIESALCEVRLAKKKALEIKAGGLISKLVDATKNTELFDAKFHELVTLCLVSNTSDAATLKLNNAQLQSFIYRMETNLLQVKVNTDPEVAEKAATKIGAYIRARLEREKIAPEIYNAICGRRQKWEIAKSAMEEKLGSQERFFEEHLKPALTRANNKKQQKDLIEQKAPPVSEFVKPMPWNGTFNGFDDQSRMNYSLSPSLKPLQLQPLNLSSTVSSDSEEEQGLVPKPMFRRRQAPQAPRPARALQSDTNSDAIADANNQGDLAKRRRTFPANTQIAFVPSLGTRHSGDSADKERRAQPRVRDEQKPKSALGKRSLRPR